MVESEMKLCWEGKVKDIRVSLDTLLLAEFGLIDTVDFGEFDTLLLEGGGGLLVVRGQGLAVTTPERSMRNIFRSLDQVPRTMVRRIRPGREAQS